jgi:hypothetical protein
MTRHFVAIAIVGFFFLKASGVRQEYAQKFRGAARAIDWTTETLVDEAREITGVIDVRVSQEHCIDRCRRKGGVGPIPIAQDSWTLEETTVDQHSLLLVLNQIL